LFVSLWFATSKLMECSRALGRRLPHVVGLAFFTRAARTKLAASSHRRARASALEAAFLAFERAPHRADHASA
jgi:hypothetical protein